MVHLLRMALPGFALMLSLNDQSWAADQSHQNVAFQQVLQAIGDKNVNGKIEERELVDFFSRNSQRLLEPLTKIGLKVETADRSKMAAFFEDEAIRIMNEVDADRSGTIDSDEFALLYGLSLSPPIGVAMAQLLPAQAQKKKTVSVVGDLPKTISVRQSYFDKAGIARPATATYSNYGKSDETRKDKKRDVIEIKGAVAITPNVFDRALNFESYFLDIQPVFVYEADLSTDATVGRDRIVHRAGLSAVLADKKNQPEEQRGKGITDHFFGLTFDYATDRRYDAAAFGLTASYTFDFPSVAIGPGVAWGPNAVFNWRPYLGFEYASVSNPGRNPKLKDFQDYANFIAKLAFELRLYKRFTLTAEGTYWQELMNASDAHLLYVLAGRLALDADDIFSIQLSYEHGEKSPDFVKRDVAQISFGVKF